MNMNICHFLRSLLLNKNALHNVAGNVCHTDPKVRADLEAPTAGAGAVHEVCVRGVHDAWQGTSTRPSLNLLLIFSASI